MSSANNPLAFATPDGTTYHLASVGAFLPPNNVFLPDYIEDTNGNQLTLVNSNPQGAHVGSLTINDTLGRALVSLSGIGATGNTISVAGFSNPYRFTWTTTSSVNFSTTWTRVYADPNGCDSLNTQVSWPLPGVSSIQLPNLKQYSFAYDPTYGLLSQITYPSGGWVKYQWTLNLQSEAVYTRDGKAKLDYNQAEYCKYRYDAPALLSRKVSFDGTTVALEQDFNYSTTWSTLRPEVWLTKQTTVTTHDYLAGQTYDTVYTYSPFDVGADSSGNVPVEQTITYKSSSGSVLKTISKTWYNQYQLKTDSLTLDGGQTSQTTLTYNASGQLQEKDEYDYGATAPTRKKVINYQAFANTPLVPGGPSINDRPCQVITYDGGGTRFAETDYFYDNGATTTPCNTAGAPSVSGVSNANNHDETNYGPSSTFPRGNLTQKTQWLNTGSSPATTYTYDETGQVTSTTDPCGVGTCSDMTGAGHTTTYRYGDSYTVLSSGQNVPCTSGCPSNGTTNAYLTTVTDPLGHSATFTYDYNNGQMTTSTDANSQSASYIYNDLFARPTQVNYPDGGQTTTSYNDTAPSPNLTTTKLIDTTVSPNVLLTTTTTMDGFGHAVQSQITTDPDGTSFTATSYDGLGRTYKAWNPTRCSPPKTSCGESTWGVTTYTYDALGRTTNIAKPDGSNVLTSYSGNQTTITDEAGNQRKSQLDAFGRLTGVWEGPNATGYNFVTVYQYDVLNNLICAVQKGTDTTAFASCASAPATWRPRSFIYDSLSRLTSATNPEPGTISYQYDLNSNLSAKTAPKPGQTGTLTATTNYSYDTLSRVVAKTYSLGNTLKSLYSYDGTTLTGCPGPAPPTITSPTNLIGRRSAMCAGASASTWSYDAMGRPIIEKNTNKESSAVTFSVNYAYYKDGSLNTLTYPSGDVVTYAVGGAGRVTQLSDASNSYVGYTGNSATYNPAGSLASMTNGHTSTFAGIVTSDLYNDRLQPILTSASASTPIFSLCYDFHLHVAVSSPPCSFAANTTGDNGNLFQALDNVDSTRSAAFQYDPLNRIKQANTTTTTGTNCWGEVYTIDVWGNLTNRAGVSTMTGCSTELLAAPAGTNNQLTGLSYDAAGNVTNDGIGNTPTYDAENRIVTDAGFTYSYDGDGMRTEKSNGSSGTMYWAGLAGETLAETGLTGTINEEYIYFNDERIARVDRPSGAVHYYFSDHLGSSSVITDASGNVQERYYYYPYGGIQSTIGSDPNHYKFTGKERDSESGLDNFGARFFTSNIGRFMTPDWAARPTAVPYAVYGDPQSLNLYTYVRNDPISRADDDGHGTPGSQRTEQANDTAVANGSMYNLCVQSAWECPAQAQEQAAENLDILTHPSEPDQGTDLKTVGKGAGEVGLGGLTIGLAIASAPETGGGSLAALAVAGAVLGGTAEVGNGIVDIAHGSGAVDAKTAEDAKQGVNIANNPVAANALLVTNARNAENIGNVANGAVAVHDVAKHSTGVAEGISRVLAGKDVKEGYQSAKELLHEWGQNIMQHAVPILPVKIF